jgi:hypothetical protein
VSNGWSQWVSDGEAAARAAGRRRYNALRRDRAQYRRIQVAELLLSGGWNYGAQARIAEELGVSDATISRDLKAIFPGAIQCPVCACRHPLERWRELERQGRVKLGPGPSDDERSPPGRDEDGDVDGDERRRDGSSSGQRGEVVLDDPLRRLVELTNEMTEQNAAAIIGVNASRSSRVQPTDFESAEASPAD